MRYHEIGNAATAACIHIQDVAAFNQARAAYIQGVTWYAKTLARMPIEDRISDIIETESQERKPRTK